MFLPHPRVKVSIVGGLRDREVACSASNRQGSNFESCVWRTVSSQSSHHPQEVLLAQFSLYVHKGGLKPDSFHFKARNTIKLRTYKKFKFEHSLEEYLFYVVMSKLTGVELPGIYCLSHFLACKIIIHTNIFYTFMQFY